MRRALFRTDRARSSAAYVKDVPQLDLAHCRVNRFEAEKEGFVWRLYMGEEDGPERAEGGPQAPFCRPRRN